MNSLATGANMIKDCEFRFIVANIRRFARWQVELAGIPSAGDRLRTTAAVFPQRDSYTTIAFMTSAFLLI
jgi:hypothetical protein